VTADEVTEMVNLYRDALDRGDCVVEEWREMANRRGTNPQVI